MYFIRLKGDNRRWKVREAISLQAAINCINHARVTGSVGSKDTITHYDPSIPFNLQKQKVLADVVQVNSDGTERKPYSTSY